MFKIIQFITFGFLFIMLIYVSNINIEKIENRNNPTKTMRFLIFLSRFMQYFLIIYFIIAFYEITYFLLHEGNLPSKFIIQLNNDITSTYDWGIPILILLYVFNNIALFGILEITVFILKDLIKKVAITKQVVRRFIMISTLFIIKIFISILSNFFETGRLGINYEHVMIYGIMLVLIRLFVHGSNLQEDSDLSI